MSASAIVAKTPVPLRLPFVKGEEVVYVSPMDPTARLATKVRRVVNVKGYKTTSIRYYSVESAIGVLIPAVRLLHTWEA